MVESTSRNQNSVIFHLPNCVLNKSEAKCEPIVYCFLEVSDYINPRILHALSTVFLWHIYEEEKVCNFWSMYLKMYLIFWYAFMRTTFLNFWVNNANTNIYLPRFIKFL